MKIVGLTYGINNQPCEQLYLKPDSALLVNDKPFFIPSPDQPVVAHACLVAKINCLGKQIAPRFADRYYDEIALALNLQQPQAQNWIEQTAFDNSLIVGQFLPKSVYEDANLTLQHENLSAKWQRGDLLTTLEQTIATVSQTITLRMGDMVAVDFQGENLPLQAEQRWTGFVNQTQTLYCKVK